MFAVGEAPGTGDAAAVDATGALATGADAAGPVDAAGDADPLEELQAVATMLATASRAMTLDLPISIPFLISLLRSAFGREDHCEPSRAGHPQGNGPKPNRVSGDGGAGHRQENGRPPLWFT